MVTRILNTDNLFFQPVFPLEQELSAIYAALVALFRAQPAGAQRALETQAGLISNALLERRSPLRFLLPAQVVCRQDGQRHVVLVSVPERHREQKVGGFWDLLKSSDLNRRLRDLESSKDRAVSTCGQLLRFAIARHLVYRMAPIPNLRSEQRSLSAYAGSFLLPQWVPFDEHDNLILNSIEEAKTCIAELRGCLSVLEIAVWLAPYFCCDAEYRRKHDGLVNQLTVQGRALGRHQTSEIIRGIKRRVSEKSLNRGLSLSLPFFDDQALEMKLLDFDVIPRGRIEFVPAYVVIAARMKELDVEHSSSLGPSNQAHIIDELKALEAAFDYPAGEICGLKKKVD